MKCKIEWNVPNVLTMIRILLVGVFVYLFLGPKSYWGALVVYLVASLTDVLDGYIARKYNLITDFGKLIDPLADKLMLFAALLCLTIVGIIHWAFLVFIVIRDLALIAGSALLLKHKVVVYARIWGKLSTLFFNAGVALSVVAYYVEAIAPWHMVVLGIAVVFGIAAFCQYATSFFRSKAAIDRGEGVENVEGVDKKKEE